MHEQTVGIVGFGFAGQLHAEVAGQHRDKESQTRVVAVCDPDQEKRAAAVAQGYAAYPTLPELLSNEDMPDILVVSAPPAATVEIVDQVVDALSRPQALLLEKPLATVRQDAIKITDTLRNFPEIMTMVGYTGRYHPEFARAIELITTGVIGTVNLIIESISIGVEKLPDQYVQPEFGGCVLLNGGHSLDHIALFTQSQPGDWQLMQSATNNSFWKGPMPDSGHIVLQLNGYHATEWKNTPPVFANTSLGWPPHPVSHGYTTQVYGSGGYISIEGFNDMFYTYSDPNSGMYQTQSESFHPNHTSLRDRHLPGFAAQWQQFVEALVEGEPSPIPLSYALAIQHHLADVMEKRYPSGT